MYGTVPRHDFRSRCDDKSRNELLLLHFGLEHAVTYIHVPNHQGKEFPCLSIPKLLFLLDAQTYTIFLFYKVVLQSLALFNLQLVYVYMVKHIHGQCK